MGTKKAPFHVFGYYSPDEDIDIPFNRFVDAVEKYQELVKGGQCVVYLDGVSQGLANKIRQDCFSVKP